MLTITAEMVCYMPVPAPFIRFGGEWVDEALGFAMGWNFYLDLGKIHFHECQLKLNILSISCTF